MRAIRIDLGAFIKKLIRDANRAINLMSCESIPTEQALSHRIFIFLSRTDPYWGWSIIGYVIESQNRRER